ncbi:histone H3-K9 methyltransferase KMT1 [Haplosporangium sp. Z 767]|nr:histone H3-K9 methyltransferase KMT1 [Haplosporangium sp. Z 767]KAF9179599.1 histone H3-K9 methyltransferase KMT1 [Haplosporangium sp. Z 11]
MTKRKSAKEGSSISPSPQLKRQNVSSKTSSVETVEDESEKESEFEVEEICGIRDIQAGQTPKFFVKWVGYSDSANTWEPLGNLGNCMEMVQGYLMKTFAQNVAKTTSYHDKGHAMTTEIRTATVSEPHPPTLDQFEDVFNDPDDADLPRLRVESCSANASLPLGFKYLKSRCVYGKGVPEPDRMFASSCACAPGQCTVQNGCDCMKEAVAVNEFGIVPFDREGRVEEKASTLLWECSELCGCGADCISKVSQQGRRVKLKLKWFPQKGWGVVLDQIEAIPPRTFIVRYTGEIITSEEADERDVEYKKLGFTYLFDLDYNNDKKAKYSIDAYMMGNESRFVNHSCDPNLSIYNLAGGETAGDPDVMTLSFWSNRWIQYGDELTVDYNGHYLPSWLKTEQIERGPTQNEGQEGMTPCYCGAANCRKWIFE